MSGLIKNHPVLGWMFMISAVSLAGVPPFSGFIGKLKIAEGGFLSGEFVITLLMLLSSLLVLYSVMKIFINGFWGDEQEDAPAKRPLKGYMYPAAVLLFLSLAIGLGTELIAPYFHQAADTLVNPEKYIEAVLKE